MHSFSYVDSDVFLGPNPLLRNAMGWLCCINTAPSPVSQASVSMENGLVKSGSYRTGAGISACLRTSNAF